MKILETGKFIEQKGLELVVALAVLAILFSGWIFYFYSWRAVSTAESNFKGIILKESDLDEAVVGLDERSANLEKLKQVKLSPPDIFR